MNTTLGIEQQRGRTRAHLLLSSRALQLCAIATCAALLLGLAVSFIALLGHGDAGVKQTDFMAYYSGARLVIEGHGGSLYNFAALGRFEQHLVYPLHVRNGVLPFVYPPYGAVLLGPLAALPYGVAYLVWTLLNCALLAVTVRSLQRYLRLGQRGSILLWLATFSFLPVFVSLAQGQTSILLLALFLGGFSALRSGQDELIGVCLALAMIKPPFVAPFVLILLLQCRWKALGTFTLATGVLALLPLFFLGSSADVAYVHTLIRASSWHTQFGYGPEWNNSLSGFVQLLLSPAAAEPVTLLLDVGAVAALAWTSLRRNAADRAYALAVLVALLIGPHVLIHDVCLVLLPICAIARFRDGAPGRAGALIVVSYALLLLGLRLVSIVHLQLSVIGLVALACWLALSSLQSGETAAMQAEGAG